MCSIALANAGQKGHIHLAFGEEMRADYQDNDQLVAELDQQILNNYVLHATNCFAYEMLFNQVPNVKYSDKQITYDPAALLEEKAAFVSRMQLIPEDHRAIALAIYANPVKSKLNPDAQWRY